VKLSTCAVDGATIRYVIPEDGGGYWEHADPALDGHRPDPDDGYVSGPDRDDLPLCTGCRHPEHEEDGCEERVSTGRYGSDGVLVYDWCSCTGPARCGLCGRVPAEGEAHRQLYAVGETGEDAEEVCVGPDRRQLDYAAVTPDPWLDPDAAAAAVPPPF
jgi:hypothetical protein